MRILFLLLALLYPFFSAASQTQSIYDAQGRMIASCSSDKECSYLIYTGNSNSGIVKDNIYKNYQYNASSRIALIERKADGVADARLMTTNFQQTVTTEITNEESIQYQFDAFGDQLNQEQTTAGTGPVYTDKLQLEFSDSTYNYNARNYRPEEGRFLSVDPVTPEANPFNWYSYAANNPILFTDPTGMEAAGGGYQYDYKNMSPEDIEKLQKFGESLTNAKGDPKKMLKAIGRLSRVSPKMALSNMYQRYPGYQHLATQEQITAFETEIATYGYQIINYDSVTMAGVGEFGAITDPISFTVHLSRKNGTTQGILLDELTHVHHAESTLPERLFTKIEINGKRRSVFYYDIRHAVARLGTGRGVTDRFVKASHLQHQRDLAFYTARHSIPGFTPSIKQDNINFFLGNK